MERTSRTLSLGITLPLGQIQGRSPVPLALLQGLRLRAHDGFRNQLVTNDTHQLLRYVHLLTLCTDEPQTDEGSEVAVRVGCDARCDRVPERVEALRLNSVRE